MTEQEAKRKQHSRELAGKEEELKAAKVAHDAAFDEWLRQHAAARGCVQSAERMAMLTAAEQTFAALRQHVDKLNSDWSTTSDFFLESIRNGMTLRALLNARDAEVAALRVALADCKKQAAAQRAAAIAWLEAGTCQRSGAARPSGTVNFQVPRSARRTT